MRTRLSRWGNSLALRIPGPYAKEVSAREGTEVEIRAERGVILILPIRRRLRLADLVKEIRPENLPETVETDRRGREVG